jgi:hypothetical protein
LGDDRRHGVDAERVAVVPLIRPKKGCRSGAPRRRNKAASCVAASLVRRRVRAGMAHDCADRARAQILKMLGWKIARNYRRSWLWRVARSSKPANDVYRFFGLPRLANEMPRSSAAFRNSPARFKASVFCGPFGIARAASRASSACSSRSRSIACRSVTQPSVCTSGVLALVLGNTCGVAVKPPSGCSNAGVA